jgi:hypothetical protein
MWALRGEPLKGYSHYLITFIEGSGGRCAYIVVKIATLFLGGPGANLKFGEEIRNAGAQASDDDD